MKLLAIILLLSINCQAADDPRIIDIHAKEGGGTAFAVIAPSGKVYLVTNEHVCGKNKALITKENGIAQINPVIKVYDKADLCILETDMEVGFPLAKSYYKGESVLVTGYPEMHRKDAIGNIEGLSFIPQFNNFYLDLTADCKPGSSGSPVLNSKGEIVGVVALVPSSSKYHGSYAVPLGYLKDALRNL